MVTDLIGSPDVIKRRTFTSTFTLPRFKTGLLIAVEHGGQQTGYRNPAVVGRELREELKSGKWTTQAELASSLGVCMTLLKTLLALTRLDPIVEELFVSLGDPLPEGRRLNHHRMKNLVRLPKNRQWVEAQQLIEEAGMDIPPDFAGEAIR
ncbi:MAG: hypothetical protein V1748_07415 [Actinomycetota bacterium]